MRSVPDRPGPKARRPWATPCNSSRRKRRPGVRPHLRRLPRRSCSWRATAPVSSRVRFCRSMAAERRYRFSADGGNAARSAAMQRADLVAGWIAQVGNIKLPCDPFAPARWVFDTLATIGDPCVVENSGLLGAVAQEANGAAIGERRGVAIDRLGDGEHAGLRAIEDTPPWIGLALRDADGAQHGVVEPFGRRDVVGAEHDVREHALLSFC